MFCPKCGNKVDASKAFCPDCGEKIKKNEKDKEKEIINENNDQSKVSGLSVTGFVLGTISLILGMVLIILVASKSNINWGNVLTYIILGLSSGLLAITGLVASIIGLSKHKDAFGVIGIITTALTIILDFVTIIIFIVNID